MKAYFFLIIGALWIIIAAFFSLGRFSFGVYWQKGTVNPAIITTIFRLTPYVVVFGWIVPTALGLWLLWTRK
jgi:hypothetical protein